MGKKLSKPKRSARQIHVSNDLALKYLDVVATLMVVLDKNGRVKYINRAGQKLLGYKKAELIGCNWFAKIIPVANRSQVKRTFREIMSGQSRLVTNYTNPVLTRQGNIRQISWQNSLLKNSSGEIIGTISSGTDVTAAEKRRNLREKEFSEVMALFNNVDDVIYVTDMDTYEILFVNEFTKKVLKKDPVGGICYREFQGLAKPCSFCTNKKIKALKGKPYRWNFYNKNLDKYYDIIDRVIDWPDGRRVRFELARDITDHHKLQLKLEKSEKLFKSVVTNAQEWIWEMDKNGLCTYSSPMVLKILGYRPEEIVGKKYFYDFMAPPDNLREKQKGWAKIKSHRKFRGLVSKNITKDGREVYLLVNGLPVFDDKGNWIGFRGSSLDITALEKSKHELAEAKSKLDSIIESIPDLIFTLNRDLKFTEYFIPTGGEASLYAQPRQFLGKKLAAVMPPVVSEKALPVLKKVMTTGRTLAFEYDLVMGGQKKYYSASVAARKNVKGKVIGLTVVSHEITDIKVASEELKKFKQAVASAGDQIIITDADGVILYANQATTVNTGYSNKELIGQTPSLWGQQMSPQYYKEMWRKIKTEKQPFIAGVKNIDKNKMVYDAKIEIYPIFDAAGKINYYLGIERDITEAKQLDRAKTEFVSLASHQLRSPLTAINWYAEMLLGNSDKIVDKDRNYLQQIYRSSRRMCRLIDSLLNISRIETGSYSVNIKLGNVAKTLNLVLRNNQPIIIEKKLRVTTKIDPRLPLIKVDGDLMATIFETIISNACKYTPAGGKIEIELGKKGQEMIFRVTDTGCGIPRAQQGQIFQKLFRADNAAAMDPDGHGLGLYVVKSILEKTGGKIWFTSVLNRGSNFYVALPLQGMKAQAGEKRLITPRLKNCSQN